MEMKNLSIWYFPLFPPLFSIFFHWFEIEISPRFNRKNSHCVITVILSAKIVFYFENIYSDFTILCVNKFNCIFGMWINICCDILLVRRAPRCIFIVDLCNWRRSKHSNKTLGHIINVSDLVKIERFHEYYHAVSSMQQTATLLDWLLSKFRNDDWMCTGKCIK